jgi:hypothetical protein
VGRKQPRARHAIATDRSPGADEARYALRVIVHITDPTRFLWALVLSYLAGVSWTSLVRSLSVVRAWIESRGEARLSRWFSYGRSRPAARFHAAGGLAAA